jgi:hypothetical protein
MDEKCSDKHSIGVSLVEFRLERIEGLEVVHDYSYGLQGLVHVILVLRGILFEGCQNIFCA